MTERPVRWGIVSTANIARVAFLPALKAAGGVAYAVGGRDLEKTRRFAEQNGVERAFDSYQAVWEDPEVEAVYVATPNSLHGKLTMAALRAGKAVLCEKPLCDTVAETEEVLRVARESEKPLWEAFVFPFHEQTQKVLDLIAGGSIGAVTQIQSTFHFNLSSRVNVRLRPDLGGGALQDVGCYCIAFARLVLAAEPEEAAALTVAAPEGVDEDCMGALRFPGGRTLVFSSSMRLPPTTYTSILGTEGEIRLSNPFHARADDRLELRTGKATETLDLGNRDPTFTPAIKHINAVLRGEETPRHLAVDEALGNARAIAMVYRSAGMLSDLA